MIKLETPARLHLGIFPPAGDAPRYGGVGIALSRPRYRIAASPTDSFRVTGPDSGRLAGLVEGFCAALALPAPKASFSVEEAIPPHRGLGSGTQLALAAAQLSARLHGFELSVADMARLQGRGRRSLVGAAVFEKGGFVYDPGLGESAQRHPFPADWRFILASPDLAPGPAGAREKQLFSELSPRASLVRRGRTLVEDELLPALAESDLASFGDAVCRLDAIVADAFGFVQGGRFSHPELSRVAQALRQAGCVGIGQSSWGPTMYGVVAEDRVAGVEERLGGLLAGRGMMGVRHWTASADNRGAVLHADRGV